MCSINCSGGCQECAPEDHDLEPTEQPEDPRGRFMLNAYGRECWHLGYQCAMLAIASKPPVVELTAMAREAELRRINGGD